MKELKKRLKQTILMPKTCNTTVATNYFFIMGIFLVIISLAMGYQYYATIGQIGDIFAKQLMKDYVYKFVSCLSVGCFAYLVTNLFMQKNQTYKERLESLIKSPVLGYLTIFMLLTAYDVSMKASLIGSILITLCVINSKAGYTRYVIHPVVVGYFSMIFIEVSTYAKFGLFTSPTVLTSPFTTSLADRLIVTHEHFVTQYYSLETVVFGFYEGALSFTLSLFLIIVCLFLLKRQMINGLYVLIYVGGFLLSGLIYGQVLDFDYWLIILSFLNGNILFAATFLISDTMLLPQDEKHALIYIGILTILTSYCTFGIHFMMGPFIALAVMQVSYLLIRIKIPKKIQSTLE